MRLLHRYRVVRLGASPAHDVTLESTLTRRSAHRRRATRRLRGERDIAVLDALTGRFLP